MMSASYQFHQPPEALGISGPIREYAPLFPGPVLLGVATSVIGIGDIDRDGVSDLAVAAPGSLQTRGQVTLYSGATGDQIRTLTNDRGFFGSSMANIGDINNDGVPDLLVGSQWNDPLAGPIGGIPGQAVVYSGADGTVIRTHQAADVGRGFGAAVAAGVDLDADGTPDYIISDPTTSHVYLYSGADGSIIRTISDPLLNVGFGTAVAVASSGNTVYIAVGNPYWGQGVGGAPGEVSMYTPDGTRLWSRYGSYQSEFGASIAFLNVSPVEVVGSGLALAIGAPGASAEMNATTDWVTARGRVDVLQLIDGAPAGTGWSVMGDAVAGARFGQTVTNLGDLDHTSGDDLGIYAQGGTAARRLRVYYDRSTLAEPVAIPGVDLTVTPAVSIASPGDLNNDGVPDLLVALQNQSVELVPVFAAASNITIRGATDDLGTVWFDHGGAKYLKVGSVVTPFSRIPGLTVAAPDDLVTPVSVVKGVLSNGDLIFADISPESLYQTGPIMFLHNGVATSLESLVGTIERTQTGPIYARLRVIGVAEDDRLLLEELPDFDNPIRVWTFSGSTLTYLWNGSAIDINASGEIIGNVDADDTPDYPAFWSPTTGYQVIVGLIDVGGINDDGVVAGAIPGTSTYRNPGHLGTWTHGVLRDLGPSANIDVPADAHSWRVYDIDNAGRILAADVIRRVTTDTYVLMIRDATGEFTNLDARAFGPGAAGAFSQNTPFVGPTFIAGGGWIVLSSGIANQIADEAPFRFRAGSPVATIDAGTRGVFTAGVNEFGDLIVIHNRWGLAWSGERILANLPSPDAVELAMFIDPKADNAPFLAVVTGGRTMLFNLSDPTQNGILNHAWNVTPIVTGLTTFTNADGVAHLVGLDAQGQLVIYFHRDADHGQGFAAWIYDNLSVTHLHGLDVLPPQFTGSISAFAPSWHSMHINALGTDGHVYSVWWAPGSVLWNLTDISAVASAPQVHGRLASFVTPWGTLHVNAVDDTGAVVSLWWAPGFGGAWRTDRLNTSGAQLEPDSITSYVTAWGGLNVAGRDSVSGRLVIYWWAPNSPPWHAETPMLDFPMTHPPLEGALSSDFGEDTYRLNIAGVGADGHAYRFWFEPNNGFWKVQDLTRFASV